MMRLLSEKDHSLLQEYLGKDPVQNIYLIHGLQTCGLASDHVAFWGAFNNGQLGGVLFADDDYETHFGSLVGESRKVLASLGKLALRFGVRTLAGRSTYVQPLIENVPARFLVTSTERLDFLIVRPGELKTRRCDFPVRAATSEDINLLVELYKDYELSGCKTTEETEREIRRAMGKGAVYFVCEIEGRAVSGARVFPQSDMAGMIDGGTTLPNFRGRGIYPCVRRACYEHLFELGKTGVSLVNVANVPMQRIIDKQGGRFVGQWLIAVFRRKTPLRRRILPARLRRWGLEIRDRVLRLRQSGT